MLSGRFLLEYAKKNNPNIFNGQKRTKFEKPENAETPGKSAKSGLFGLKNGNQSFLKEINLMFCSRIHREVFFHAYIFLKIKTLEGNIVKQYFSQIVLHFSKKSKYEIAVRWTLSIYILKLSQPVLPSEI